TGAGSALPVMVEDPLELIVRALSADDELETSRLLSELARRPEPKDPRQRYRSQLVIESARQQLWRTGRTSELGFCPLTPRSRRVGELSVRASDGSIG